MRDWQPSYESVCAGLHAALGALIVLLPGALFGRSLTCAFWGFIASVAFAAVKEAADTLLPASWGGEKDSWADSWVDFRGYVLGAYTGLVVALVGVWLK